jgi:hypothetical protein
MRICSLCVSIKLAPRSREGGFGFAVGVLERLPGALVDPAAAVDD